MVGAKRWGEKNPITSDLICSPGVSKRRQHSRCGHGWDGAVHPGEQAHTFPPNRKSKEHLHLEVTGS